MYEKMKSNIVLVGFMGSGKSTIGRKLAGLLDYEFVDTDTVIEREQGCSITDIFAWNGEKYFRDLEHKTIKQFLHQDNLILSTGGGVLTNPSNYDVLQKIGHVVFLNVNPDVMFDRICKNPSRPLLKVENPKEKFLEILDQRMPLYKQVEHEVVVTDEKPFFIAKKILKLFPDLKDLANQ